MTFVRWYPLSARRAEAVFGTWVPPVETFETQDHLVIRADMHAPFGDPLPTVHEEREWDSEGDDENAHPMERAYGEFPWSCSVPTQAEAQTARAKSIEIQTE